MMKARAIAVVVAGLLLLPGSGLGVTKQSLYSRYRAGWYIGFGIGTGWAQESFDGTPIASMKSGLSLMFKVGWVLGGSFMIGYDMAGFGKRVDVEGEDYLINIQHHNIMTTFYPRRDLGLFLKGGVGFAARDFSEAGTYFDSDSDFAYGFDARIGGGYEFQLLEAFNLGFEIGYAASFFKGDNSHDAFVLLTFSWY